MQDFMIVTSGEWVLLALATVALINSAYVCLNMRKTLVRAETRPAFHGLSDALADVRKRAGRKAKTSR